MSTAAQEELAQVTELLDSWALTDTPDQRLSPFADSSGKLHTPALYKMIRSTQNDKDPLAAFIWKNRAPPRVQFFAWLLVRDRIQSREHLQRKHVLPDATCEACNRAEETAAHIMLECDFAASFPGAIRVVLLPHMTTKQLHLLHPPEHIPANHFHTFLLLCCWQLWKHRNNLIFRQQLDPLAVVLRAAREEARTWGCRLPQRDLVVSLSWCSVFESAM